MTDDEIRELGQDWCVDEQADKPAPSQVRQLTYGEAMAEALLIEDEDAPEDDTLEGKLRPASDQEVGMWGGGDVSTKTEFIVQYRDKRFVSLRDTWATWETYDEQAMAESLVAKLVPSSAGVGRVFRIIRRETTETVLTESPTPAA